MRHFKPVLIIVCIAILAACGSTSAEEQIHMQLTKAIEQEERFQEQQQKIIGLETEEQNIYNEIIAMNDLDEGELDELSNRAISSIEERKEEVEIERESIEASRDEFAKIEPLLSEVDDPEARENAEKMFEQMNNRYAAYDTLFEAYQQTLEQENELYHMLLEGNSDQDELTDHIQTINESYELVLDANDQFNMYTIEYNELKEQFYERVNIAEDEKS